MAVIPLIQQVMVLTAYFARATGANQRQIGLQLQREAGETTPEAAVGAGHIRSLPMGPCLNMSYDDAGSMLFSKVQYCTCCCYRERL